MCLIVSIDRDHSTDEVIDWLTYFGGSYERVNVTRDIEVLPVHFEIGKKNNPVKYKVGWIRKNGYFRDLQTYNNFRATESFDFLSYLYYEMTSAKKYYYIYKDIQWVAGKPGSAKHSKTELLSGAIALGIDVPATHIINNKQALLKIMEQCNGDVITKPITDVPAFEKDGYTYIPLTRKIRHDDLEKIPDLFFPSLIQQMVHKKFEIRSFYLEGKFYSAAIFSQSDSTTAIDFRNYNLKRPNRIVPYSLPKDLEIKLTNLFEKYKITCGSADIIYGQDGKFYFLEINETGQFGMISKPCNLQIEKIIASELYQKANLYETN
jgi:ATP-GRASP peptide maturase of grasp-with-spasm system